MLTREELEVADMIVRKYANRQRERDKFMKQFAPKPEKAQLFLKVYNRLLNKFRYTTSYNGSKYCRLEIYSNFGLESDDGEELLEFLRGKFFAETGVKEVNLCYGHKGEQDYIFSISIRS